MGISYVRSWKIGTSLRSRQPSLSSPFGSAHHAILEGVAPVHRTGATGATYCHPIYDDVLFGSI